MNHLPDHVAPREPTDRLARIRGGQGGVTTAAERRARRNLHPLAWWMWALACSAAALRTTNPVLLGLVAAVAAWVVASRRTTAPWAGSFGVALRLGAFLVLFRVLLSMLFGLRMPGTVLFTLPEANLPEWAAGVSVGGPVTVELIVQSACEGLRLAAMIACVGAANSLASPYRLLRSMPAVLYEAGVAVTVGLAFAPQVAVQLRRMRDGRRLRGRRDGRLASVRGSAVPVLEGGLERAVALAASMDARGYGRRADVSVATRRVTVLATLGGVLGIAVGMFAVLDAGMPRALGMAVLAAASASVVVGMSMAGRKAPRTRYRPDLWRAPEWVVVASGVAALVAFVVAGEVDPSALAVQTRPLEWPAVPPVALAGVVVAALPAWVAPHPPVEVDPRASALADPVRAEPVLVAP